MLKLKHTKKGRTSTSRRVGSANLVGYTKSSKMEGYTHSFHPLVKAAQESHQLSDIFNGQYSSSAAIEPVYPFHQLHRLLLSNNTLRQCIESYVTNIESQGNTLEYIGPEGSENSAEAVAEKQRIEHFLTTCTSGGSLREARERSRWDVETYGCRFFEVGRSLDGVIHRFDHVATSSIRMTRRDAEATPYELVIRDPETGEYTTETRVKNFRRFVQRSVHGQSVYFKEFGDPRKIDPKTGEVNENLAIEDMATEIIDLHLYTPGSVYGTPRWIGTLPAILGSRESELVNLNFFRENAIPAMAVLVSGGALTEETFNTIEQYVNARRGRDSMNRIMVIEASTDADAGGIDHSQPAPKVDMKPMLSERQQDGLFQDYDQKNIRKIRSAFRLPPIFLGMAEDYTRASAYASLLMAENQIFAPERNGFDAVINDRILITHQPKFWRYKSFGPSMMEPETLPTMLDAFESSGALTPNAVIKIANKMLDIKIEPITDDWGDFPFEIVMHYIEEGKNIPGVTEYFNKLDAATGALPDENTDEDVANSVKSGLATMVSEYKNKGSGRLPTGKRRSIKREERKRAAGMRRRSFGIAA